MSKMNKVWLVSIIDEEPEIFGTARGAYEYLREQAEKEFDEDDGVSKILEELADEYANWPDSFGIEDFGGAVAYFVR